MVDQSANPENCSEGGPGMDGRTATIGSRKQRFVSLAKGRGLRGPDWDPTSRRCRGSPRSGEEAPAAVEWNSPGRRRHNRRSASYRDSRDDGLPRPTGITVTLSHAWVL
jgi:hypothetical protein